MDDQFHCDSASLHLAQPALALHGQPRGRCRRRGSSPGLGVTRESQSDERFPKAVISCMCRSCGSRFGDFPAETWPGSFQGTSGASRPPVVSGIITCFCYYCSCSWPVLLAFRGQKVGEPSLGFPGDARPKSVMQRCMHRSSKSREIQSGYSEGRCRRSAYERLETTSADDITFKCLLLHVATSALAGSCYSSWQCPAGSLGSAPESQTWPVRTRQIGVEDAEWRHGDWSGVFVMFRNKTLRPRDSSLEPA